MGLMTLSSGTRAKGVGARSLGFQDFQLGFFRRARQQWQQRFGQLPNQRNDTSFVRGDGAHEDFDGILI